MDMIRFDQSSYCLHEAEHVTMFLVEMSVYRKEWQLALPDAFQQVLFSSTVLLDTCVSLLIRPRLLAYVIEVRVKSYILFSWHDVLHTPLLYWGFEALYRYKSRVLVYMSTTMTVLCELITKKILYSLEVSHSDHSVVNKIGTTRVSVPELQTSCNKSVHMLLTNCSLLLEQLSIRICQQLCNKLDGITTLVTRLFWQVWYGHDITIL